MSAALIVLAVLGLVYLFAWAICRSAAEREPRPFEPPSHVRRARYPDGSSHPWPYEREGER